MDQPSNTRQTVAVIFIAISLVLTAAVFAVLVLPPLLACGITLATRFLTEPEPQTHPPPWSGLDDVQYFAPGHEFKLSREAAAKKAFKADLDAQWGLPTSQTPAPNLPKP